MKIDIDRNIYSDSCISKVVYWFADQYTINRRLNGNIESLTIEEVDNETLFKQKFFEKLNDYKLRNVIEDETKDIRTILYAKAFGDFDDLTEEEITE